jgi:hypothetical protein
MGKIALPQPTFIFLFLFFSILKFVEIWHMFVKNKRHLKELGYLQLKLLLECLENTFVNKIFIFQKCDPTNKI